eukprot:gene21942-28022_t
MAQLNFVLVVTITRAFDYRVLHRGTANRSENIRPILVFTFAKPWYKDLLNFPHRSLFDVPPPNEDSSSNNTVNITLDTVLPVDTVFVQGIPPQSDEISS